MLTKTVVVFFLATTLANVALCATTPRPRTRRRLDHAQSNTILQTPTAPPGTIKAEMAICMPENQTVKLDLPKEAGVMFSATCVRVERCGGCCTHPLLTCKPTSTENVTYEVERISRTKSHDGTLADTPMYEYVNVTRHVQCECQCKVTQQDCSDNQTYDENNCACMCNNIKEQRACKERKDKLWDTNSCTCSCRKILECPSQEEFSQDTCRCEKVKQ